MVKSAPELTGYWRFDEPGGDVAQDQTGQFPGTYAQVGLGVPGAVDPQDTGAEFDGQGSVFALESEDGFSFAGDAPFSLEIWIRPFRRLPQNVRIITATSPGDPGRHGYEVLLTPGMAVTFNRYNGEAVDRLTSKPAVEPRRWSHLVATFDGETMSLYINGTREASAEATLQLDSAPARLAVGRRAEDQGAGSFEGSVDEFAVYRRALSADEVASHHAAALGDLAATGEAPEDAASAELDRLWETTVVRRLQEPLWRPEFSAAAPQLMLPLQAAFELGRRDWLERVSEHFQKFVGWAVDHDDDDDTAVEYLYLCSRCLALCTTHRFTDLVPRELPELVANAFATRWASSAEERESQVLPRTMLLLAGIAGDLQGSALVESVERLAELEQAIVNVARAFARQVRWNEAGGCYFGLGGDSRSPSALTTGEAFPLPLVLDSLAGAFGPLAPARRFFDHLRGGLAREFERSVLIAPGAQSPLPRLTNYINGENEDFRAATASSAEPYALSGALALGWFSRLPGEGIRAAYAALRDQFPLEPAAIRFYASAGTRENLPVTESFLSDGTAELVARLVMATGAPTLTEDFE